MTRTISLKFNYRLLFVHECFGVIWSHFPPDNDTFFLLCVKWQNVIWPNWKKLSHRCQESYVKKKRWKKNLPKVGRGWSTDSLPRWRMSNCLSHLLHSISSFAMMLNVSSLRYNPITLRYFVSKRRLMLKHVHRIMLRFSFVMLPLFLFLLIIVLNFFSVSKYSRRPVPGLSGASSKITKYLYFLPLLLWIL